jgi:hypothetical protein
VDEELRSPLLDHDPGEPTVFLPGKLLEAARRRKRLPRMKAPAGCLLDFGGELVQHLAVTGRTLDKPVMCLAHVTNTMATREEYFEKGGETGLEEALKVCELALEVALEQEGVKEKK